MPMLPQAIAAQQPQQPPQWVDPYEAQRQQLQARMNAPVSPMYTPEQAAQRQQQNQNEYELGLLGQLSGNEQLGQVGGMVLKRAMAQRDPHVGERGTTDQLSGKFTYSPDYLRRQDEGQMAGIDQKSAASRGAFDEQRLRAQEALQRQREHDETMKAMKTGVQDSRSWTAEDRMFDDFNRDTKNQTTVINAHKTLQSIAKNPNAASDIAFVFSYMKMLDPNSVVREGEYATAANAAGVPDRVKNYYNKALTGAFLSPQQRAEMLGTAERISHSAQTSIDEYARSYADKAGRRGLDLDAVTGGAYGSMRTRGLSAAGPNANEVDVGAMLKKPPAAPQVSGLPKAKAMAYPKGKPGAEHGGNRVIDAGW
jgi:hypothetical protein